MSLFAKDAKRRGIGYHYIESSLSRKRANQSRNSIEKTRTIRLVIFFYKYICTITKYIVQYTYEINYYHVCSRNWMNCLALFKRLR